MNIEKIQIKQLLSKETVLLEQLRGKSKQIAAILSKSQREEVITIFDEWRYQDITPEDFLKILDHCGCTDRNLGE